MTDDAEQTYMPTREAAVLLGVSHNRALEMLHDNHCGSRTPTPRNIEWRRADVEALRDLRESGALQVRMRSQAAETATNYCSHDGAVRLKARIEEYWRERGATVEVELVEAGFTPNVRVSRTDVRSDMLNGWPRQWSKP